MSDSDNSLTSLITGIVLGAVVGAGVYYFLNQTEEGKQVKKTLKEKSKDALDDLAVIVKNVESEGQEFKKRAVAVQNALEEKASSFKENVVEDAKEGLSQIEELRERGRRAAKFFLRNGKSLA